MVVVRFVFTYMLVLFAVEFLLLTGGRSSDREFFLGVLTAVPVTIVCWMMPQGRAVAAYMQRMRATGLLSHRPRPAARAPAGHHAAHGSSLSR